jgi:L-threonylcarbamoyladenylate synthase
MTLIGSSRPEIERAAEVLRAGGLVAFPTETVYGLGARAAEPQAVTRVFRAKGRPADHPLIVHLSRVEEIDDWARDIPDAARELGARYWPGPLTLILKRRAGVPDEVTGGQDTVGLRVPNHAVALALIHAAGGGLAAPSANRYGRLSPTTAHHVLAELEGEVDLVVDGGPCAVGLESTILDLSGEHPRILRPGAITAEALAESLGPMAGTGDSPDAPRVPGSCATHYAPRTPLYLVPGAALPDTVQKHLKEARRIAVLAMSAPLSHHEDCRWTTMPDEPSAYGRMLYASLRDADGGGADCILVALPPPTSAWEAVHDRLRRAAAGASLADSKARAPGAGPS